MANTLTDQIGIIYRALDTVSRELTGLITSVNRNSTIEEAGLNQTVNSFVSPAETAIDITPSNVVPDDGDATFTNVVITLDQSRQVPVRFNSEEMMSLKNGAGQNFDDLLEARFEQSFRTLTNEIELSLAQQHKELSRAVTPVGTTLFDSTNYTDLAQLRKVLDDNGAPLSDRTLILNTTAGSAIRGNQTYVNANTAGTDTILRQGTLLETMGFTIKESAQIINFTKGDGTSMASDNAGYAIGATTITVTATDEILAGDIITFNNHTATKYVVKTGTDGNGTIVLNLPGLRTALPASTQTILLVDEPAHNIALQRDAIVLATRPPAAFGDMAVDRMLVQDPRSNLAFDISEYTQFRQKSYMVGIVYGSQVVKPEHGALLVDAA